MRDAGALGGAADLLGGAKRWGGEPARAELGSSSGRRTIGASIDALAFEDAPANGGGAPGCRLGGSGLPQREQLSGRGRLASKA